MKTKYDKEVDAKYVTFKEGRVAKTEPITDWLNLDVADDGSVIGIEILDASEHNIGISTIGGEFVGYFDTQLQIKSKSEIPTLEVPKEMFSGREIVTNASYA